jgi:hypothetical protein
MDAAPTSEFKSVGIFTNFGRIFADFGCIFADFGSNFEQTAMLGC